MTTKDVNLKNLLAKMHKLHDPNAAAVVKEIEALLRECDAWKFKYDNAMARIECLECQVAKAELECPVYIAAKESGKLEMKGNENGSP